MSKRGSSLRRAVFLDRDGVLNRSRVVDGKAYAPRHPRQFHLMPGAAAAVAALKRAGFVVVVVTNQPDVGHGKISAVDIDEMHARLMARASVDAVMVCTHRQDQGCACRKPRPGMLLGAIRRYRIDPKLSFMVGDRSSDVAAGRAAGARTIFIDRRYAEGLTERPDARVRSLAEAARWILRGARPLRRAGRDKPT